MKIWHFSDTHQLHHNIEVPKDIDVAIFSGDCSNTSNRILNRDEVVNFLNWYESLDIPIKIFVAGNHDVSIEAGFVTKQDFEARRIIYLENDYKMVAGLKIWGSPITPDFNPKKWAFNKPRTELGKFWDNIPLDADIVITHGPAQGMLDLAYDATGKLEFCGCYALYNRLLSVKPKFHMFGHIHNNNGIINSAFKCTNAGIIYSNGSCVTDRKFSDLSYLTNGNVFEI